VPDCFHDSLFSGQLAKHGYHRDLHPLAILTSIIVLSAIGETINIMTLGGLALAVGILVDDATVEVENINRNREAEPEKDMDEIVLDSASQIATPAFVSTLSICIVFAPCSCCPASRGISLCHSPKQWFSRCWPPISFRGPSFRQWPNTCCGEINMKRAPQAVTRWFDFRSVLKRPSRDFVTAIAACWRFASATGALS